MKTIGHSILKAWTQACPIGISWLSQSLHAHRLSAVNVPLTACHVSPYWRSEVEWNDSSGLHRGGKKQQQWGKCGRAAHGGLEHAMLLFPHMHEVFIINPLLIQRGEVVEVGSHGFFFFFLGEGRSMWDSPCNVVTQYLFAVGVSHLRNSGVTTDVNWKHFKTFGL